MRLSLLGLLFCQAAFASTVLNMTFDSDTPPTVTDSSGSNNNGTLVGASASVTNCFSGGCYAFNGTSAQYISVPTSASLDITAGITISAWVWALGIDEYPPATYLVITDKAPAYYLSIRCDGVVLFYLGGVANWVGTLQDDHVLFDGAWHHVIATYDGSAASIYIDGKLNSTQAETGTISVSGNNLKIGQYFRGQLDDVRIQDAGLDAAGALALWQSYGTLRTTPQPYYVSTSGNDANDGLSTITPWKSLAHVYQQCFRPYALIPGDSVLLKRGETWSGQLSTSWLLGSGGLPITFSSYGSGAKPVIYGDGRGATWQAVPGYTGVYETILGSGSTIGWVFEGPTHLFGTPPNYYSLNWRTLAQGNWSYPFKSSDRIWIRTIDDAAPSNMTLFGNALNLHRSHWITVDGIDFASYSMGRIDHCSGVTVTNSTITYTMQSAVYAYFTTNCIIASVTANTVGDTGIYLLSGLSNVVQSCTVNNVSTNINGFLSGTGDCAGVGMYEGNANLIERCTFLNPSGHMSGALDQFYENDTVFRWNYVEGANGFFPHGNNNLLYGNLFYGKGTTAGCGGVGICPSDQLAHNTYGKTGVRTNNYIYNNTFWDASGGLIVYPGAVVQNNIFYGANSLIVHRDFDLHSVGHSEFGDVDYNCFYALPPYTASPHFTVWQPNWPGGAETLYQSFAAYKAATGTDAHSVYGDPVFFSASPVSAWGMRIDPASPAALTGVALGLDSDFGGASFRNPPSMGAWELLTIAARLSGARLSGVRIQ